MSIKLNEYICICLPLMGVDSAHTDLLNDLNLPEIRDCLNRHDASNIPLHHQNIGESQYG